jgi:penicillin-binding protein 1B
MSRRQPGSVFKPFVYAAAFDNAVQGLMPVVTPATTVMDEPTTFDFDGKEYTPDNYGEEFHGMVTTREALTESLNVATIKVAEMIGYGRVVDLARQMGLSQDIQATPAVALGAYDMTPLDVAAGYTAFANGGTRAEPLFIDRVVNSAGQTLESTGIRTKQVLDPRVAYQVTSVLEDVIDHGTGAPVRARGFAGPAAGKTGTSRDGWFAGYTSNLLCIVWVGFDDNRELTLTGGNSAAPIWAEFMKRATALPAYHDLQDFQVPDGINVVDIDPQTQQLASPACPNSRKEVFIAGTEPTESCGGAPTSFLGRLFGGGQDKSADASSTTADAPEADQSSGDAPKRKAKPTTTAKANPPTGQPATPADTEQKKSLLNRIFGIFKSN